MSNPYPTLDLNYVRQQLAHAPIGHTLDYHIAVPSTMPLAAELARDATIPSGVVVVAEEQTSGRGRSGRSWHAPRGSALLTSILLKSPHSDRPQATLTMVAGNALLAAVAATVPEIAHELHLKWPNDLVLGNDPASARKIAGILAESAFAADGTPTHATLGIGINVNQLNSELPRIAPPTPRPTSLRMARAAALGTTSDNPPLIDRGLLLVHLCQHLAKELTLAPAESYQQWRANLNTLDHTVAVYAQGSETQHAAPSATLVGQAIDVQTDGALVVLDEHGKHHTFHAADVSVRAT